VHAFSSCQVSLSRQRTFYICFAALVALWFASGTQSHITDAPLRYDSAQNVKIAYRFVHSGVFNFGGAPRKAMKREPVPVLVAAALLLLHPSFENYKSEDLLEGRLTSTVKLANVFWEFLAALFIFLLCLELFQKPLIAGLGGLFALAISNTTFLSTSQAIDTLLNELPAAALMLVASWCALRFLRDQTPWRAIALGIAMGLLALTKAAFFSIGIGFILLLAFIERRKLIYETDTLSPWRLKRRYALLLLAFLATVAPWIARNAINYGRLEMIAGRGEGILGVRMMLAELPSLGVLYASSPPPLRDRLGPSLGYTPADLEQGGRLGVFQTHPERQWLTFESERKVEGYEGTTEQWLRRKTILSAANQPLEYLASVGLFAYRGIWFMEPAGVAQRIDPVVFYALNALSLICLLGVFFGGLIVGNKVLVGAFALAVGSFIFYSALSYGLPRYSAPMTPFAVIAVFWALHYLGKSLVSLTRRLRSG
jgi:hypothetical protein